jgi:hypothetical protein
MEISHLGLKYNRERITAASKHGDLGLTSHLNSITISSTFFALFYIYHMQRSVWGSGEVRYKA